MKAVLSREKEFPLIKEVKVLRILRGLILLRQNPLNRDAQRDAILSLYDDKEEKSVFRGMVIPSFRKLGLLQGWEDMISLSANGAVIAEAAAASSAYGMRAFRAVLLEKDREHLKVVEDQIKGKVESGVLYQRVSREIAAPSERQKRERLARWLALLHGCGLVEKNNHNLTIIANNLKVAQEDLRESRKAKKFSRIVFQSYREIVRTQHNIDVVDIAELRSFVAVQYFRQLRAIVTEKQFDNLFRRLPLTTSDYLISLGKPMGPEEQLFDLNGRYYRTVSIRDLRR